MEAVIYDIPVTQKASKILSLTYYNGTEETKTPVNLTGCSARLEIKLSNSSPTLHTLLSPANITLGGTSGAITIDFSAGLTTALERESYSYALFVTFPTGEVRQLMVGKLKVKVWS